MAAKGSEQTLTVGEVARMAGVNAQTVRYYERRGLLPEPPRRSSGYRAYPLETVSLIRFIKKARELGFSLGEVGGLLALRSPGRSRGETGSAAQETIRLVDEKISRLASLRAVLASYVEQGGECLIVESLNEGKASDAIPRRRRQGSS
jgi:DNA-binding transcriptional MerR regulator